MQQPRTIKPAHWTGQQWTENGKQWVQSPLSMNPYYVVWSLREGVIPLPEDGQPPKPVSGVSSKLKIG
jgi:hypothetical protein